jgi:prefoldin subunit 5
MSMLSASPIWWVLLSILLTVLLVVVQGAVTYGFDLRRSRLPEATRWDDLNQRLASINVHIQERGDLLTEINQKIQDRDRIGAEVAALLERLSNLRAEIDSLDEAARQVDLMKHSAAEAAEAYAREREKLDAVQGELDSAARELDEARQRLRDIEENIEKKKHDLERFAQALPPDLQEIKSELERLRNEKSALVDELDKLRGERGSLFAAREEVTALSVQKATLEQEIVAQRALLEEIRSGAALASFEQERSVIVAELQRFQAEKASLEQQIDQVQRLIGRKTNLEDEIADLERRAGERSGLENEVGTLRAERSNLIAAREEVATLAARKGSLEKEVSDQLMRLDEINSGRALAGFEAERAELMAEVERLKAVLSHLRQQAEEVEEITSTLAELTARKVALEEDVAELRGERDPQKDDGTVVADLRGLPECLKSAPGTAHDRQTEENALYEVGKYLETLGLKYDSRTIASFHTALKINEVSQMTVLAGVSGTGKSLLPRRYAEAMGISFLQIAVEPRWDSPQDLLGFYNYIEKRYRGTELARALVHMDPFNTSGLAEEPFKDHILLVLLDEMNLARVEYYFSEFLSLLEVRPPWKDAGDEKRRAGACLPIDIRGRKQGAIKIFPAHNVLFAGTMNDDESTQSLSDKVLDRSNVMQFAAPESFAKPTENVAASVASDYRSFREWHSWIKPSAALTGGDRDKADRTIKQLAVIMERCGRPFGHRLNESILTYVANYPRHQNAGVAEALTDQVEFRILPKLRGLTIEEHQSEFADLAKFVHDDLQDHAFAKRLNELVESQRRRSGQFNWRGLDRG